ncbi:MAG: hypothetical protein A2498_10215 [Lentisphaerae bacterium RIFOXYC12_FULL_60_16]|nr:MAG: hypothetical protein A2498_10215 [Lentisphaerae bacterium RIFOXYC12_FULL_60_16]OGV73100.1 MAG: hypothetical protein A2269_01610 [Lentisphaerae bacterium RIFOXYA12_FULL_60_10]OGV85442.1 MAG: hypothetical protein A2340_09255 [Lentisphaerae bacterium RIFOXYB12_FULL_60_10]
MELTQEQKATVTRWAGEGAGLSEIQKRLASELNIKMTFMDVRFLVLDLNVEIQNAKTAPTTPLVQKAGPDAGAIEPDAMDADGVDSGAGLSSVQVSLDRIMVPGSLVSGTVTFSDGVSAKWQLDQMGRLAVATSQPGYKPSQEDLASFQQELRSLLENRGF